MVALNVFLKSVKGKRRRARSGCRGGTSGRGHKGYKARSGSVVKGFEGGQTPIYRRLPRRGFVSKKTDSAISVISLKRLASFVKDGICDIDIEKLKDKKIIKNDCRQVKLIGSSVDASVIDGIKEISVTFASNGVADFLKKSGVKLVLEQK